mmetsp:Transcript_30064/g.60201  ORF Transcript_30064/g.60201 Transcript_30064/m.60201 type:complete len:685 (-) Transcript_30064:433-2487(-)
MDEYHEDSHCTPVEDVRSVKKPNPFLVTSLLSPASTLLPNLTPSSLSSPDEENSIRHISSNEECRLISATIQKTKSFGNERKLKFSSRRRGDDSCTHATQPLQRQYALKNGQFDNTMPFSRVKRRIRHDRRRPVQKTKHFDDDAVSTPETAMESSDEMSSSDSSYSPERLKRYYSTVQGPLNTVSFGCNRSSSSAQANSARNPLKGRYPLTTPKYSIDEFTLSHCDREMQNFRSPNMPNNHHCIGCPSRYLFCCILSTVIISFTITAAIVNERLVFITLDSDFGTMGPRSNYMDIGSNHKPGVRRAVIGLRPLFSTRKAHSSSTSASVQRKKKSHEQHKSVKAHSSEHEMKIFHYEPMNQMQKKGLRKVANPWKHRKKKKPWAPDPFMYGDSILNNIDVTIPRVKPKVAFLHEETKFIDSHRRDIELFPSRFSDNTQLYPVLDSGDEALSGMELREPYEDGECKPMKEWQTTFHPTCNGVHEIDFIQQSQPDLAGDFHLFGTKGYWRNAWKIDFSCEKMNATHVHNCDDTIVMKTLKFHHNFEDAHFEHNRIDAVAMERLTSSPHVINVFGFCAHSVMTEYANGQRVGTLADKSKRKPLARLKIARDIASGLADVHEIDGSGEATFVHFDINPANVVSIDGMLKLNDFNIGVLLKRNETSGKACGFPAKYPNPQVSLRSASFIL